MAGTDEDAKLCAVVLWDTWIGDAGQLQFGNSPNVDFGSPPVCFTRSIGGNSTMAKRQQAILFLGTDNHYRSRCAEILFNKVAEKFGLPWRASSRGLALERAVKNVGPMSAVGLKALQEQGISAPKECARPPEHLTISDLEKADRIVALNQDEHRSLLDEQFPAWSDKVEFWNVDKGSQALELIEEEVMGLVARLLGGGEREAPVQKQTSAAPVKSATKSMTVRVGRETKGRRGKGVTTVWDVPLDEKGLQELAATLKQKCGTGGTVKDGRIEIQGDLRKRVVAELEKLGYKVKQVGG